MHDNRKFAIEGAVVKLVTIDSLVLETKTKADGSYSFDSVFVMPYGYVFVSASAECCEGNPQTKVLHHSAGEISAQHVQDFVLKSLLPPIRLPEVIFKKKSAKINKRNKDSLDLLYKVIIENPTLVIEVRGHYGNKEKKIMMKMRAESVMGYLFTKGIDISRITAFDDKIFTGVFWPPELGIQFNEELKSGYKATFVILRTDYKPSK